MAIMVSEDRDDKRLEFLIDSYKTHVDYISNRQERRFEILRYAFVGLFAYFAFLFSVGNNQFVCRYPFEFIVLVPSFLIIMASSYIGIINGNIRKHGSYIRYLFENGLKEFGLGTNHFDNFVRNEYSLQSIKKRWYEKTPLHPSQIVLVGMIVACLILFEYLWFRDGLDVIANCGRWEKLNDAGKIK
ncbi:MAG: hypothetical protein ACTSVG_03425 [Alphaproteobacteria bacterium]